MSTAQTQSSPSQPTSPQTKARYLDLSSNSNSSLQQKPTKSILRTPPAAATVGNSRAIPAMAPGARKLQPGQPSRAEKVLGSLAKPITLKVEVGEKEALANMSLNQRGGRPRQFGSTPNLGPDWTPQSAVRDRRIYSDPTAVEAGNGYLPATHVHFQHVMKATNEISRVLDIDVASIERYLKVDSILAKHDEFAASFAQPDMSRPQMLHVPLHDSINGWSCAAMIGDKTLLLPLLVFECIELLYAKGLKNADLFGEKSQVHRLGEITAMCDHLLPGEMLDLTSECTRDVFGLLYNYISYMPEPPCAGSIVDSIMEFCVFPRRRQSGRPDAARYLLQMLPEPVFNLMVYVTTYLHQVPGVEGSDLDHPSVGYMFGPALFGQGNLKDARLRNKTAEAYCWILFHWEEISEGIFDNSPPSCIGVELEDHFAARPDVQRSLSRRSATRVRAARHNRNANSGEAWSRSDANATGNSEVDQPLPTVEVHEPSIESLDSEVSACAAVTAAPCDQADSLHCLEDGRPAVTPLCSTAKPCEVQADDLTQIEDFNAAIMYARRKLAELEEATEKQEQLYEESMALATRAREDARKAQEKLDQLSTMGRGGASPHFEDFYAPEDPSPTPRRPCEVADTLRCELEAIRRERDTAVDILSAVRQALCVDPL